MDAQRDSLLSWAYFCHGKTMEELRQSLLCTTLELEQTKIVAQEEVKKRDDQLIQIKDLLSRAISERDEAQERCRRLALEKLLLQQQGTPLSGVSSVEDEKQHAPRKDIDSNNNALSSDCEESIVSSPVSDPLQHSSQEVAKLELFGIEAGKPLPEKGKLLQAVIKAGPLLQTLLLAGPLPQWRHPPPRVESFEIPPVTVPPPTQDFMVNGCGKVNRKRVLFTGPNSPGEAKYQRIVLP